MHFGTMPVAQGLVYQITQGVTMYTSEKIKYVSYDKVYILVSVSKYKVFYISVTRILW